MNKDEEVELLDTSSDQVKSNQSTPNVEVPVVPSGMGANMEDMSPTDTNVSESSPFISPLVSKPTVSGTTSDSPRILPEGTMFANSSYSKKQAVFPQQVQKDIMKENELSSSSHSDSVSGTSFKDTNSKSFKPLLLIVVFILIFGAIIVLPYSQDIFNKFFTKQEIVENTESIDFGDLICTMENDNGGNSYQYTEIYSFKDNKVNSLKHEVLIQGEADYLNERNSQCQILKQNASSISGVTVDCHLSSDEMEETQFFNLTQFDSKIVTSSFTEAGGVYPNVKKGDDYKEIKRIMEMGGYDCKIK